MSKPVRSKAQRQIAVVKAMDKGRYAGDWLVVEEGGDKWVLEAARTKKEAERIAREYRKAVPA